MMETTIEKDKDSNDVPYVELSIQPNDPRDGCYYITFRKYPKRVFVGVEDYRGDQSSGADLEDCWSAPVYIIQKTPREVFDPHQAFLDALVYLGEINPSSGEENFDLYLWEERYTEIEKIVEEWSKL